MNQRGVIAYVIVLVLALIIISVVYLLTSKNLTTPKLKQAATGSAELIFDDKVSESTAAAKEVTFFPVEITNKAEADYWDKVYGGEAVHDISAFTVPYPANESAQTIEENKFPRKYHKALLNVRDLLPKNATPEAYMNTAFYVDHYQFVALEKKADQPSGHVYLEYFERTDYPVDSLLAYQAKLKGLVPNTKYQIMVCKYSIDCSPETSTDPKISDQYQLRYFVADDKGEAEVLGLFPANSMMDRMIVVKKDSLYNYSSTDCGSIKLPCLVTSLPKVLVDVHPTEYWDHNHFYADAYQSNPDSLKQAIKNKYLSNYSDLTFKDGIYQQPEYEKDIKKALLVPLVTKQVDVFEVTSCQAGLRVMVDKIYGDMLGFKFVKC